MNTAMTDEDIRSALAEYEHCDNWPMMVVCELALYGECDLDPAYATDDELDAVADVTAENARDILALYH